MEKPFPAYMGDDPYVFVCYAHANEGIVYPELTWLREQGVNIWYDEGISAGRIWRTEVGEAIKRATRVLFYISKASLVSDHCSGEINYALDQSKDILPVYLEDTQLTTDLQVGLSSIQALHRDKDPRYLDHLLVAVTATVRSTPVALNPSRPARSKLPVYLMLMIGLVFSLAISWRYQTESETEAINLVIEPIASDSEASSGLEYEIQRLLATSPNLVVRVSDGPAPQADYTLQGEIVDDVLISRLVDRDGASIETWQIPSLPNNLSTAARTQTGDLLISLGLSTDALSQLDEEISPQTFRTYLAANALLRRSHTLEALESAATGFSRVLKEAPSYAPAHAGLCSTYLGLYLDSRAETNIQLAETHCHRALTLGGQDATVHNALGMLYRETGQAQKGIDSYKRSLELAPYSTDAMRGLAATMARMGANTEAKKWYREAITVDPNHWENYQALGIHQFSKAEFAPALETFQTASTLAPDEGGILNNIGSAYFMLGDYKQAVVIWRQAAELDPGIAGIYGNLGTSYFYQREFEAAAEMYQKGHAIAPDNYIYPGLIGESYYVSQLRDYAPHFRQAIELALRQLGIDPNDYITVANVAAYYAALGDRENAQIFIDRAMSTASNDMDVVYYVTISYARLGDIKTANQTLNNLITLGYGRKLLKLDANFDVLFESSAQFEKEDADP
ncbi:MAG TPA: toll/interleukin-1 receptor domain-containing protein [Gammaproteobacteria bacterium]|nr:toll/interleukin-1 receptor domain-containing protein [Gammaproteobacteria bacterium]HIL98519.1 toll/interleukin-1 receptor domain-containing protein [Pseudomonadales bacterium]